jgi:DNA-binding Lrp family transcriptional regulator
LPASWLAFLLAFPLPCRFLAAPLLLALAREFGLLGMNVLPETTAMVPFFVQIKCKLGQSYVVANALAEAEIASEIYSTAGQYDLLVKFYVDKDTDIGHFVNEKVQVLPGIQDTLTIITFKAFGAG